MLNRKVPLLVLIVMVVVAGLVGFAMAIALQPQPSMAAPDLDSVLTASEESGEADSGGGASGTNASGTNASGTATSGEVKRDFLFQIVGYETLNQGGQKMNLYFHYRYAEGTAAEDIPSDSDLRGQVVDFMREVDTTDEPYWETVDLQLCTALKKNYPIEAISCQLQVDPADRKGLPYEPGYHGSTTTIGDIEPLMYAGPLDAVE